MFTNTSTQPIMQLLCDASVKFPRWVFEWYKTGFCRTFHSKVTVKEVRIDTGFFCLSDFSPNITKELDSLTHAVRVHLVLTAPTTMGATLQMQAETYFTSEIWVLSIWMKCTTIVLGFIMSIYLAFQDYKRSFNRKSSNGCHLSPKIRYILLLSVIICNGISIPST